MAAALERSVSVIRAAGPFDLGRIARLHRLCFDEPWNRADLAHLLALPGGFGLIARIAERRLAGFERMATAGFALCRVVKDECELLSIGVDPEHRRQGIAIEILRHAVERCRGAGAGWMFLEVAIDNLAAQQLYEGFGFEVVGRREAYYRRPRGGRVAALTMRAPLRPSTGEIAGLVVRP